MSERTVRVCPLCGHEAEKMKRRSMVICDQCGTQADKVYSPDWRGLAAPEGWTGGFHEPDDPAGRNWKTDFCSQDCRAEYEKTHDRLEVIA